VKVVGQNPCGFDDNEQHKENRNGLHLKNETRQTKYIPMPIPEHG
jgi:hypothetical protein